MAYNINKSNSDPVTIPTGAIDNQFDIPLIGQDAINYGDDLALAFVRLLENFANTSAPSFGSGRTTGQLWYDTTATGTLKVYDGTSFVSIPKTSEVVQNTGDESLSGDKTFTGTPAFNGGTTSVDAPFTVDSTFMVTNLNAEFLDVGAVPTAGTAFRLKTEDVGKQTKYVPATEMYAATTNGAGGLTTVELTAGQPELRVWSFDPAAVESVQFTFAFPKEWNEGTVTYQIFWTADNSPSTNAVVWGLQGVAMGATEEINVAFGTAVTVTSSNDNAVYNLNVTSESTAVTVGGTPGEDNLTYFRLYRDAGVGGDDLAVDAHLLGIKLFYTTDAPTSD